MKNNKAYHNIFRESGAGFTLIEILIVMGIIAVLATIVIVAINPVRQFAQARNTQRISNVNSLINAYGQRLADHKGLFRDATETICAASMDIPTTAVSLDTAARICKTGTAIASCASPSIDMRPCIVTDYMSEMPTDPSKGVMACTDTTCTQGYDSAYVIYKDATTQRVTVCAPKSNESNSSLSQNICVTR